MTSIHHHGVPSEFPFASLPRSSNGELILVQLMTSVWETILQLSFLARDGHDDDHPAFTGKCAGNTDGREPGAPTEAEVRGWLGGPGERH